MVVQTMDRYEQKTSKTLMVVQTMDRYAQKTSKTLMVIQTMDRYEHCVDIKTEVCRHHQATVAGGRRVVRNDIGGKRIGGQAARQRLVTRPEKRKKAA